MPRKFIAAAIILALLQATPTHAEPGRALWVWSMAKIYPSTAYQQQLLDFLDAPRGNSDIPIKTVFCSGAKLSGLTDPESSSEIRAFNSAAHARGVTVYLLCGDPSWAEPEHEQDALDWVDAVIAFNAHASAARRFDGFQYDVEPAAADGWPSPPLMMSFHKLFVDTRHLIDASGERLLFSAATQMAWAEIADPATGVDVDQDVIASTDNVAVMSYRTTVDKLEDGADRTFGHAVDAGKKCWVGVETNDETPPSITFYRLGDSVLEGVLAQAYPHFGSHPGWLGYAIEDYAGYSALAP